MIITIETDIVRVATSENDKYLDLFDTLDDLAELLDNTRAEYLLRALLERFNVVFVEEPTIDVELENIPLAMAA